MSFVPDAIKLGVRAKFAFPLRAAPWTDLGVLVAHRDHTGSFTQEETADARSFTTAATEALLRTDDHSEIPYRWLRELPPILAEVHQAVGMLTCRLEIDAGEALIRLRAHAYAHQQTLAVAAYAIISGNGGITVN